jgi:hypothetical protein
VRVCVRACVQTKCATEMCMRARARVRLTCSDCRLTTLPSSSCTRWHSSRSWLLCSCRSSTSVLAASTRRPGAGSQIGSKDEQVEEPLTDEAAPLCGLVGDPVVSYALRAGGLPESGLRGRGRSLALDFFCFCCHFSW